MRSIKKTTPFSFLFSLLAFAIAFFGLYTNAQAQTDDLMIVEYVDWDAGSGVAVKIYNPTPVAKNLNNYRIKIFGNGNTTASTDEQLTGMLQPCETRIFANDQYCNSNVSGLCVPCTGLFSPGVNGDDVVALTTSTGAFVDMIGRVGYSAGNNNSQKVNNVNDALYQHKLVRQQNNLARYSLTSGTYNPAITNAANIWPNNQTTNVTGWNVGTAACLNAGLPSGWTMSNLIVTPLTITNPCKVLAPQGISLNLTNNITTTGPVGSTGTVSWTGGTGTFDNPTGIITNYRPSPADPAIIVLTATITYLCRSLPLQVTISNGATPTVVNTVSSINDCPQDSILLTPTWVINPVFEWRTSNGKGTFKYNGTGATYYFPVAADFSLLKFHAVLPACNSQVIGRREIQNGRDTLESPSGFTFAPQFPDINEPVTFSYTTSRPQTDFFGNWNYTDGTPVTKQQGSQQHNFTAPGTYDVTVNVLDAFNCPRGTFTRQIVVSDPTEPVIPSLFTPNADNLNDSYRPKLPATSAYQIKIFNRWGGLVFESDTQEKAWDGKNASDGVYYVYLKATYVNGKSLEFKTPVTLLR